MRSVFSRARTFPTPAVWLLAALVAFAAVPAVASDAPDVMATTTPARVLAAVSGGFWSDEVDAAEASDAGAKSEESAKTSRRGYYRSIAVRSQDNTSRLFLQRIRLTEDGPELLDTREINELTEMKAYITDMRPEDSTGIAKLPGFVTFVYLKRDPSTAEPDTWELFVDEFGDLAFTPATN